MGLRFMLRPGDAAGEAVLDTTSWMRIWRSRAGTGGCASTATQTHQHELSYLISTTAYEFLAWVYLR